MTYVSQMARFRFRTYMGAAQALLAVLEDARKTKKRYQITGLTPESVLLNGLLLEGEIEDVSEIVSLIPGATRQDS